MQILVKSLSTESGVISQKIESNKNKNIATVPNNRDKTMNIWSSFFLEEERIVIDAKVAINAIIAEVFMDTSIMNNNSINMNFSPSETAKTGYY